MLLKRNAVRSVYRAELPSARPDRGPSGSTPTTAYLKVYHDRSLRARLRNLWRGRPAEREWQAALYAERAGIPAVRAAAVCRALPWNGGVASALLLEGAPGTPLDEYWLTLRDDLGADGPRRRAANAPARMRSS